MTLPVFGILTLSNAIEMYFVAKRAQRLSEHTLSDYKNRLSENCRELGIYGGGGKQTIAV